MIVVQFTCPSCSGVWKRPVEKVPKNTRNVKCSSCRLASTMSKVETNRGGDMTCFNCRHWSDKREGTPYFSTCALGHYSDAGDVSRKRDIEKLTYYTDGCEDFEK